MISNPNLVYQNLRNLSQRYDEIGDGIAAFNRSQADGEHPDPARFVELMAKQSATQIGMQMQTNLWLNPAKWVLDNTK